MSQLVTALLVAAAVVLSLAGVLATARITRGPTMLDRAITFDVVISISLAAIALEAAFTHDRENVPLLLVATMLGFVGSVSIARFSPGSDDVEAEENDRTPRDGTGGGLG